MLVSKSKAAELAGVSRRTFYNHISKKGISTTADKDGAEKIDVSELKRVYGHEVVLRNLKALEDTQGDTSKPEKNAQQFTQSSVKYEKLLLEEKLNSAEVLIKQLKSERDQLLEDKSRTQQQLEKALEIGTPIGKLLTDQRDLNEGRAVADRKAIEEQVKREMAEKRIKSMAKKLRKLQAENIELKSRGIWNFLLDKVV